MTDATKVLFTAKVHTTGGRDGGASLSSDGRLNIKHSVNRRAKLTSVRRPRLTRVGRLFEGSSVSDFI